MLRVLDLFSGIGGFSAGLESTGHFRTVAFCESDPFCRRVLARHWPGVIINEDVRSITVDWIRANGIECDVIAAGFPCTDVSIAGRGAGIDGPDTGLWREIPRIVCMVGARWVLMENVSTLLDRGMGELLRSFSAIGFDAEWHVVGAHAVGAPHYRNRLWVLCYPNGTRLARPIWRGQPSETWQEWETTRCESMRSTYGFWPPRSNEIGNIPRMVDGVSARLDRIKAIGNAIVPQIPALIGQAIWRAEIQSE